MTILMTHKAPVAQAWADHRISGQEAFQYLTSLFCKNLTHLKKPVVTKFRASSSECYAVGVLAYDALALTILWRMEARWSDRKAEALGDSASPSNSS